MTIYNDSHYHHNNNNIDYVYDIIHTYYRCYTLILFLLWVHQPPLAHGCQPLRNIVMQLLELPVGGPKSHQRRWRGGWEYQPKYPLVIKHHI